MAGQLEKLSAELLLAVKMNKPTDALRKQLAQANAQTLTAQLNNDPIRNAFWINIYNAFFLIMRKEFKFSKSRIYKEKAIHIAGNKFSLDDVEHGILRKNKFKYSLGLFPKPLVRAIVKRLSVEKLDYRQHFALNCGAKSCPPIAFYNSENIESQLQWATQSYLEGMTSYDEEKKIVYVSKLFLWYKFDFGGKKGIRNIYKDFLDKDLSNYSLRYAEYNWEEQLDNFV